MAATESVRPLTNAAGAVRLNVRAQRRADVSANWPTTRTSRVRRRPRRQQGIEWGGSGVENAGKSFTLGFPQIRPSVRSFAASTFRRSPLFGCGRDACVSLSWSLPRPLPPQPPVALDSADQGLGRRTDGTGASTGLPPATPPRPVPSPGPIKECLARPKVSKYEKN